MTDSLTDRLRTSAAFAEVLDDVNVRFITLSSDGSWTYEKLGRYRSGEEKLSDDQVGAILEMVETTAMTSSWALRSFEGSDGPTILLERRPVAVVDRIPDEVLQTLKGRVRKDGVIVIAGPPGSGKSNMLLWATRHLANEPVLLISEIPPAESPGANVTHIRPPESSAEHRAMQRLIRRTPNVSWDRLCGLEDVNTLLGGASARRRVFTLDSSDTVSTLRRVQAWREMGYEANLDAVLQLTSSVIGRAEVLDLLVFENGAWVEAYSSSGSRLDEVRALGRQNQRKHAITQPGIEPDAPTGEQRTPEQNVRPQTPPEGRAAALRAGIRKRPGHPTQDFDAPMTIEVPDDDTTGKLENDSAAILEGFVEEEDSTSSGEIDLQGFLARRDSEVSDAELDRPMLSEDTRQYQVQIAGESPVRPDRSADESEPDEIIPGVDLNESPEGYNLENLKITRVEEVEEAQMDDLREMRRKSLAEADEIEIEELPSVEIDEEDLILEGGWEEDHSSQTAVVNSDAYEAAAREITSDSDAESDEVDTAATTETELPADQSGDVPPKIELNDDESATNPSIVVDPGAFGEEDEVTAEFTLGDKIQIIRNRLKNDEA